VYIRQADGGTVSRQQGRHAFKTPRWIDTVRRGEVDGYSAVQHYGELDA